MFFDTSELKDEEIFLKLEKTVGEIPEKGWLPAYYFKICLLEGREIGECDLRIGHNEKTYVGGNIGYGVNEEYRGNHYAAKACKLLFKLAIKHGLEYLIITCNPTNKASSRTCELAGGGFIEIANIPEDNEMYKKGRRTYMIYRFDLNKLL